MPATKGLSEAVNIPKWLWGVMVGAVVAAGHHSVMLHVTASEVESLRVGHRDHSEVLAAIKKDQAQQAAVVASIVSLKDQCTRMNDTLQLVRDDVIILKTRDQQLPLGAIGVE